MIPSVLWICDQFKYVVSSTLYVYHFYRYRKNCFFCTYDIANNLELVKGTACSSF